MQTLAQKSVGQSKGTFKVKKAFKLSKEWRVGIECSLCNLNKDVRYASWTSEKYKGLCSCQKEKGNKHHAWKGCGELSQNHFRRHYHAAIDKNLEFSLTIEYAWSLFQKQNGICALSGWEIKLEQEYNKRFEQTASLDRIDSNKGYVEDNVQWVHRDINYIKGHCDNDYFIEICNSVAKKNKLKVDKSNKPVRYDRYKWKEKRSQ